MTNETAGFIVILDSNLKPDETKVITSAITLIKGVLSVEPLKANGELQIAETRAWQAMTTKILEALKRN